MQKAFVKQQQEQNPALEKQARKLVILPAKPLPRKSKSVLQEEHPSNILDIKAEMPKAPRSKKAETGVFEELERIDQLNKTIRGSSSAHSKVWTNLKALKNMSPNVYDLIENRPMQQFTSQMAFNDSNRFMTVNLRKRKPIFKNHTKTNASILRHEVQRQKKEALEDHDRR